MSMSNFELTESAQKSIMEVMIGPAIPDSPFTFQEDGHHHVRYDSMQITLTGGAVRVTMLFRGAAMCVMKLRCDLALGEILCLEHMDGRMPFTLQT